MQACYCLRVDNKKYNTVNDNEVDSDDIPPTMARYFLMVPAGPGRPCKHITLIPVIVHCEWGQKMYFPQNTTK